MIERLHHCLNSKKETTQPLDSKNKKIRSRLRYLGLSLLPFCLASCVYHIGIQQGIVVSPTKVAQLHPGMTEQEVTTLLGAPLLTNPFDPTRLYYIYTYEPPAQFTMQECKLIIAFDNGHLARYQYTGHCIDKNMDIEPSPKNA